MPKFKNEVEVFKKILNTLPNSIYLKDRQGRYLWLNKASIKQLEYKHIISESIIGKTDLEVFPEANAAEYIKNDNKVLEENRGICTEEVVILPSGEKLTQLSFKEPLYNDNAAELIGVLGYTVDITEMKKKEEEILSEKEKAEAANKAKTEFLENMRHDIRTPLSGIIGFADIIKNEVTEPKIKEYADNLVASSYSLLDFLNEILDAIKVSSGEIPILKKKFNLHKKLNEVILLNQAKASEKKNIDLSFYYDPAIPAYLIGDATRIHRVVLELVTNALNFTHKGYIKLSAHLAKDNEDDVIVKIIVDDSGIGIPLEKQQDIYLQFKRLTPSYGGIYKGHGLGLSIAKQLIDDLNGEIYVESQVGYGTKFIFIIKLKKALLDEELGSEDLLSVTNGNGISSLPELKKIEPSIPANGAKDTYKSHILVVEDSHIAAQVVTAMLSNMDCTVDLAEKGKEAVNLAEHTQYDLIFMDIGLPDIDGYEVTKRIRLNELKKHHVPIIALTAHASEDNKKYCIDIGMNAVLTKPLAQKKAQDILNSFIPYRRDKLNLKEEPNSLAASSKELIVFDFELVKKQFGEDSANEVVALFLVDIPKSIEEIQAAYTNDDWLLVQSLTHKFKGGASYCGVMRLLEACTQLEDAVRNGESELCETLYHQLLDEVSLTEKAMRENPLIKAS